MARELAAIIGKNEAHQRNGFSPQNKIFDIHNCEFKGIRARMSLTSVCGHMTNLDFGDEHKWNRNPAPELLFDAPVYKDVKNDFKNIERTLIDEARKVDILFLWLDCDLEGEAIGRRCELSHILMSSFNAFFHSKGSTSWRFVAGPIPNWMCIVLGSRR